MTIYRGAALPIALLFLSTTIVGEEIEIGSYVDGAISNTAPVVFGEEVRVDFIFVGDGLPAVGSYNLLLRWDHTRLEFKRFEFGDALGREFLGEAESTLTVIGENEFDPFWWATFSQTSFLDVEALEDHQPVTFLGGTAVFEVIDPTLTVLGGNMGFGFANPGWGVVNYMRDAAGAPIICDFCSACPLPLSPEFLESSPLGDLVHASIGEPLQFTVSAVDLDDAVLSMSVYGTPPGAVHSAYPPPHAGFVATTLSWVPSRPGLYAIEYEASDGDPTTEDPRESVRILVSGAWPPTAIRWYPLPVTPVFRGVRAAGSR
jgi:hypothetical protein